MNAKKLYLPFILLILMSLAGEHLFAQDPTPTQQKQLEKKVDAQQQEIDSLNERLNELESDVEDLESDIEETAGKGLILFLFGVFCALWAQNTGRDPWLWFFMGLIFSVITVLVLLSKNAEDRRLAAEGQTVG